MRITYVTMQFPVPSETFASLDIDSLIGKGHEVTIIGLRNRHKDHLDLIEKRGHHKLSITHFNVNVFFRSIWFVFSHPVMFFDLLFWLVINLKTSPRHLIKSLILIPSVLGQFHKLIKETPDVVHLFWGHYPAMFGYLVYKNMPKVVLSQFLGAHDLTTNYSPSYSLAKRVDTLFTHSRSNLDALLKKGIEPEDINIVYRGTKLNATNGISATIGRGLVDPVFLTAARLIEEKGVDDVIEIFDAISSKYPEAKLYIAGDGPYLDTLIKISNKKKCSTRIQFLGHVDQQKLIRIMNNAHFFLLMSRYPSERLPNVVKEAMYQQCVVVTTRTEGIDELIEEQHSGFIVDKRGIKAAIDRVEKCLDEPKVSKKIALNAKQRIDSVFDVDKSMEKYCEYWLRAKKRKEL
ncbi:MULTISPECIES: glycosyltransferase family 4 protein [unclassified Salinivibrio]|uniref:glycosyltransferase family 4 protein n=1 Tax=unclassified Salinivibrio TaxID=2636825 RepID=UPI0009862654|nr:MULTISPECIES: glycosyltransferase family 4 protein [unclassified Salinivibrio]